MNENTLRILELALLIEYQRFIRNDKTFLTNFESKRLSLFIKAIREYGDDDLYIKPIAYDCNNKVLKQCYALHLAKSKDLSEFWKIFRKIEGDK